MSLKNVLIWGVLCLFLIKKMLFLIKDVVIVDYVYHS